MSEKEKEIEEERFIVDHWSHEHPLTLVVTRRRDDCYFCERKFSGGEQGYGCSSKECGYRNILHQECVGLPRKIRHAVHPQHTLIQEINHNQMYIWCDICPNPCIRSFYRCTSAECTFAMHIRCAQRSGVMDAADDEQRRPSIVKHPSHPKHELRLFGKYCSFMCDACGTTRRGKSYKCTSDACEYWIHERCASLPHTMKREDHYHSLSLTFHVPPQYIKFDYKCDVCNKYILPMYWIYHCELCSYAVHLKCAFNKSPPRPTRRKNDDEKGIMKFPINDVGEEQLRAFVIRQGGAISISPIPYAVSYKFHNHKLKLVSSTSSSSSPSHENSDDDDDYGQKSELICDGCITPIFQKQRSSSSSSSSSPSNKYDYYMSCSSEYCKYNLHMACFHLPPHLPSLPLHHQPGHDLLLKSSDKILDFEWEYCSVCRFFSNGLFYVCTKCYFKADIKCASMPDTIYHAAHPKHPLKHVKFDQIDEIRQCDAGCERSIYNDSYAYACGSCDYQVHVRCTVLPASVGNRKWDKHHPLPLTYDANLNHPGDFYCDECEEEMNPKKWMYHCRHCDLSFHPRCFPASSGMYRNIKFGNRYVIAGAHRHALTYQLLTTKRRCDVCGEDNYERVGFHCASCNFFICFYYCAWKMLRTGDIFIEAVD